MGVVIVSELLSCAGRPLSSPPGLTADAAPQVTDEEAVTDSFIPADSVSAVLISPRRVLVTGGVLANERVLPLTVVRFLDLDISPRADHAWTKPLALRPTSKKGKRKRSDSAFPVCRMEQTLTFVPESASLFLIGGLKVGGKDEAKACKTMFAFDIHAKLWECVQIQNQKTDKQSLGPRFAHTAVYVPHVGGDSRSSKARKASGYILVYGGYTSTEDRFPCHSVHVFDVRASRWSSQSLIEGTDPPRRAYHAGVVTASSRYFVAHGGQCSHLDDHGFLSSDLVAFDIRHSRWVRPKISPSSSTPPTARKRHSMVNGIGKHQGAIVLFGGELCSGSYSNELFILHLMEPTASQHELGAVWEQVDVRAPEPLIALVPQIQDEAEPEPHQMSQEERTAKHTGTAGGSLLAVPALRKYLVVGGRGAYGIRNSPLLLDASEVENLNHLHGMAQRRRDKLCSDHEPMQPLPQNSALLENPERRSVNLRARAPEIHSPREAGTNAASAPTPLPKACPTSQPAGKVDAQKKPPLCNIAESALRQISDEDNLPILPKLKPPVDDAAEGVQSGAFRVNLGERQDTPALQVRTLTVAPFAQPKTFTSVDKMLGGQEGSNAIGRATIASPLSSTKTRRREPTADPSDDVMDLVDDDEDFAGAQNRNAEYTSGLRDLQTPPTKRRRFINSRRTESDSWTSDAVQPLVGEDGNTPGSDFVAASELAKRAKRSKSSRGRGRRRVDATRRKRAGVSAEEREPTKENEDEDNADNENARLVTELQSENQALKRERDITKKDNLELNEQMKSLLSEIESLRAFRREHSSSARAKFRTLGLSGAGPNCDGSQNSKDVHVDRPGSREESLAASEADELKMLQSKTADLLEEYEDIMAERDGLSKALKEADDGKRLLQTELHRAKNRYESVETERDQLRRQASELRTMVTEAGVARDSATTEARKMEDANIVLRRDLERLQDQLREANSRCVEEKLQLSNAQRLVSTVKCQLTEAQKKYDHFDSKERRLKGELGSQQGKLDELRGLIDQANSEKSKAEERNIELVTEIETLKTEYEMKRKECYIALRDVEKSRLALDHEKKEVAHLDAEVTKLRRELARAQREASSLSAAMKKRDEALSALRPALGHIMNEIGALTLSAGNVDFEHSFPRVSHIVAGGETHKQARSGDLHVNGVKDKAAEERQQSGSSKQCDTKRAATTDKPQPHSSPESEDLKSPVPPSEDEEEP